jgi:hypothetical protein
MGNSSQQRPKNAKMMSFFVMPLKHVLSVMDLVNHYETQKLWAIAHKKGHTHKNDKYFVIPL